MYLSVLFFGEYGGSDAVSSLLPIKATAMPNSNVVALFLVEFLCVLGYGMVTKSYIMLNHLRLNY